MENFAERYEVKKIYENTYSIKEEGFEGLDSYMYLLVGEEKALLIDCGYGIIDLKKIIGEITDKPVICICTHGHHDHVMGVCQLGDCYIHSVDAEIFSFNTCEPLLKMYSTKNVLKKHLISDGFEDFAKEWVNKKYPLPKFLDDIPYFDLGNRKVSWRRIPGHTQGSIAVYDEKYSAIFDSDGATRGVWIYLFESSSLSDYIRMLEDYLKFIDENGIKRKFVAHYGEELDRTDIVNLISCCKSALADPLLGEEFKNPYNKARIVRSSGSVVIYNDSKK